MPGLRAILNHDNGGGTDEHTIPPERVRITEPIFRQLSSPTNSAYALRGVRLSHSRPPSSTDRHTFRREMDIGWNTGDLLHGIVLAQLWTEENTMSVTGIEAMGRHATEPFSGQVAQLDVVEQFREIVEQTVGAMNGRCHLETGLPHEATATTPAGPAAVATQPMQSISTSSSHRALAPASASLVRDPALPSLELLSADLVAGDPQYNAREVILRERLDLSALETRLKASAAAAEVDFHQSDLDGVLRNAGYDGEHLGSSDRYMASIEKFMGEAESRYQHRSTNIPGENA